MARLRGTTKRGRMNRFLEKMGKSIKPKPEPKVMEKEESTPRPKAKPTKQSRGKAQDLKP